jgi:hypothetical protein
MSAYAKTIQAASLSSDSQGPCNLHGALFTLLSALNTFDTSDDVLSNPARDVIRRLSPWNQTRWFKSEVLPFLTDLGDKISRA